MSVPVPLIELLHGLVFGCIDIRYLLPDRFQHHHLHRLLASQLHLVGHQLPEEATVGPDLWPSPFHVFKCILQGHLLVLHQIRDANGSRSADSGHAMHQRPSSTLSHILNQITGFIEELLEIDSALVQDRDAQVDWLGIDRQGSVHEELRRKVDDQTDFEVLQDVDAGCCCTAEEQRR